MSQGLSNLSQERRQLLGELLVEAGYLSTPDLENALAAQGQSRLGDVLLRRGDVEVDSLNETLARQAGLGVFNVSDDSNASPSPEALAMVPAELATMHRVLPIKLVEGRLQVAMADPFDRDAIDVIRMVTQKRLTRLYCHENDLADAIAEYYGSNMSRMVADLSPGEQAADGGDTDASGIVLDDEDTSAAHLAELAREPTVVNLVELILIEAIDARASDVHIEPFEKQLKVKYRIDGMLHEMSPPPKHLQHAIASRIKIMSGLNIAERFVPQDGHITFEAPRTPRSRKSGRNNGNGNAVDDGKVDIRVSTVPTVFGESIVMRILDRSAALISLDKLGMAPRQLDPFSETLNRPHGIVLVTGPTGSGKTTTLYASINRIYSEAKKIITIEDPVEYQLAGVNQIPVNRKRGVGFAEGLRAILRQDPDVVMVGEIRDHETADIAIRSALTGHMVFSTLHTNDACGAITRLADMGVEPFLLASSLQAVLAQRLVRKICEHCKEPQQVDAGMLERIGHRDSEGVTFYHGRGCRECRQTGFSGRLGIFELLPVDDAVREAITQRASAQQLAEVASAVHEPMIEDGYRKAVEGVTTLGEVFRVTQDV